MRIKALLTTLLLGTTLAGVASADPLVRDHRYEPVYHQPVYPQPVAQQTYGFQFDNDGDRVTPYAYGQDPNVENIPRSSWTRLFQDAHLNSQGNATFNMAPRPMTSLELQAENTGKVLDIDRVRVVLNDGRVLDVRPDRSLDRYHSPNLRIDLGASAQCGVVRVIVQGTGGGGFKVLAA